MTFEPQAMEKVIKLVRQLSVHSPYYPKQCRADGSCPVCSMNKDVYSLAREMIEKRDAT